MDYDPSFYKDFEDVRSPFVDGMTIIQQPDEPDKVDSGAVALATTEGIHTPPVVQRQFGSVSGLSPEHVHVAQNMSLQAVVLMLHHKDQCHYTQSSARWEGIAKNLKAWRGEFPKYSDCSSTDSWALWNGLDHFHHSDNVNGEGWQAGYTGTMEKHGMTVSVNHLIPADLVIYNGHVAMYTGGGLVVSHGSEGGPYLLPVHYRTDIVVCKRYI